MNLLILTPWIGSVAVAAVAAATDLRSGRIPNAVTYPVLMLGPLWHGTMNGTPGLLGALFGMAAAGLGPWLSHRRGAMGGGDVKLFSGLGGLLGAQPALEILCLSLCLVIAQVLVVAARRGALRDTLAVLLSRRRQTGTSRGEHSRSAALLEARMGGAIFVACVAVTLSSLGVP